MQVPLSDPMASVTSMTRSHAIEAEGLVKHFGETVAVDGDTYTITGIPSLNAHSFEFLSTGGAGADLPFAAHVQGIGTSANQSAWVTVTPEPATLSAGMAAAGLAGLRRRRRA